MAIQGDCLIGKIKVTSGGKYILANCCPRISRKMTLRPAVEAFKIVLEVIHVARAS